MSDAIRSEPRWPVALAVLTVLFLLAMLPERVRLLPVWVPYTVGILPIVPMAAIMLGAQQLYWQRIEHTFTVIFFVVAESAGLLNLAQVVEAMVHRGGGVGGSKLLSSAIAIWVANVVTFSVLYWQIDRGGPVNRQIQSTAKIDFLFPQEQAGKEIRADWQPTFVEYLFLSFSTATAFGPSFAQPLTPRASMLMMLQSCVSLVTTAVVASRAIGILGT